MGDNTHTPLPWRYDMHYKLIHASKSGLIEGEKTVCDMTGYAKNDDSNAELIVRSVNNHDLLVEALKGSLQMMEQSLSYRKANGLTNNTMLEATIQQAREALSKAE